jgi:PAS domain S-box-containing protein
MDRRDPKKMNKEIPRENMRLENADRQRAEEALKESEARFRSVLDDSRDVIYRLNLQTGRYEYTSPSVEETLGYSPAEFMAMDIKTALAMIHPDDLPSVRAEIARMEETGRGELEYRLQTNNGDYRWISNYMTLIKDGAGRPLYRNGNLRDITGRKKAEEELFRVNRELRAISECNQLMVRTTDEQVLLNGVCRIMCDSAGYRMAWVGVAEHDDAQTVRPVAWGGAEDGYLANAAVTWSDSERGRGPTGWAVRTGKTHFFQDFSIEPAAVPWREAALIRGYRSSIAIPLSDVSGNVFGVFTLYSGHVNGFTPAEVKLLEELTGDLAFGLSVLRDRVKSRQAEEALRESEEKYRRIIETSNEGSWEVDAGARTTFVNKRMAEMLGYIPEEMLGKKSFDFQAEEDREGLKQVLKLRQQGLSASYETKFQRKDGSICWVLANAVPIFDKNGKFIRSFGMVTDITERKKAELALQETRDYLNNLINYANAPIIVWDPSLRITQFNHAFERLTGRTAAEVTRENLDILFPVDSREHSMEHIRRAVVGERMEVEEIPILHKDRSVRIVLWNSATLYDGESKAPIATIAQGQDITERKRAEDELKRYTAELEVANKELEAFSYSVSHDLRQPLRGLDGFSQAILEDYGDKLDEKGKEYLNHIRRSSRQMSELIDDLLRLGRLSRAEMHFETVDLSDLAQAILAGLQKNQPARKAEFIISPSMLVEGDRQLLNVALRNLIENAWKFTRQCPLTKIEIGVNQLNGEKVYFIRDNGIGFDMQYSNKLFQPFQRLHSIEEYEGTGIGLAIVQRIIHRHGGRIWATSQKGVGSTFYFTSR